MLVPISEVEKIAALSRLRLSEQEKKMYQKHLEAILQVAQQLDKLDTADVPPTAHIQGIVNVLRPDKVVPSMDNSQLLANAPEKQSGCFIVPKVVE